MNRKRIIPGINIQWPWSELLLSGEKSVETRTYPIPEKHIGKELAVIETPGPRGAKEAGISRARIIGTITFSGSFQYNSKKEWEADKARHKVDFDDPQFAFSIDKQKWGWEVAEFKRLENPVTPPKKRGIVFATECVLPAV